MRADDRVVVPVAQNGVHGFAAITAERAAVAERQIVIQVAAEDVGDIRVAESVVQAGCCTHTIWKATSAVVCAIAALP